MIGEIRIMTDKEKDDAVEFIESAVSEVLQKRGMK